MSCVCFRSPEVTGTNAMQNLATVCTDASETVAEVQGAATATANCSHSTSHGCVQPLVIDARPVILVSSRQIMPAVAAAATAPVVVIQHPLPLSAVKLQSTATSLNNSHSASCTRPKKKKRRKNKVRCEQSFIIHFQLPSELLMRPEHTETKAETRECETK